jgi:outer membrane immunogenic protein
MKKFAAVLAFSTVLALGATAKAADMVPPAAYDWTGFYVGGNIGYAFGGNDDVGLSSTEPGAGIHNLDKLELNGIFGGAQIGADWQTNAIVFGAIADIEVADISDDFTKTVDTDDGPEKVHASDKIDVWGTLRGRLGWAFDRVLIYGTGGLAWANTDYKVKMSGDDDSFSASETGTQLGYTVGGGLAWAIDDNWSVGAEYLYVNLGSFSVKGKVPDDEDAEVFKTQATPDFSSIKAFVNFKF